MCKDNTGIWLILLLLIFVNCKSRGNLSTPVNFDTFFDIQSSNL